MTDEHEPKVAFTTGKAPASGRVAHSRSLLAVPGVCTKVPAAHVVHDVHDGALVVLEKVPAAHGLHTRLLLAPPGTCTKVPAAQVVHCVQDVALEPEKVPGPHALQDGALVVLEELPAGHGPQKRLVVEVPST